MKCEYMEVWSIDGKEVSGVQKVISLPFKKVSARAIIIRKNDGAILGTLHRQGGKYALPGGAVEDGETTYEAIVRELKEENFNLIGNEESREQILVVDYYGGYEELSIWHIFLVDDVRIGESEETIESRWIAQHEDVWYPFMRERLLMEINKHLPDMAKKNLLVA